MPLSSSPGIEDYADGIPPQKPDRTLLRKVLRVAVGILLLTTLTFAAIQASQSEFANTLRGKGTITGSVFDTAGNPVHGEVFVIGTQSEAKIQPDGSFILDSAPAGQSALAVAQNGLAVEYPVYVEPGTTVDLGRLEFIVVTPTP